MVDIDFVGNRVLFEDWLAQVDQTRLHSQPRSNFTKALLSGEMQEYLLTKIKTVQLLFAT
jgi:hypothetical protein